MKMSTGWKYTAPQVDAVITGTGRCGTQYVSTLLQELDIQCGHERVYTPYGISPDERWDIDASWMAVPHLKEFDGPIIHIVRHPEKVIGSLIGMRFFSDQIQNADWNKFMRYWFKAHTGDDKVDAPRFYWIWNKIIEQFTDTLFRIEDITTPESVNNLLVALQLPPKPADEIETALQAVPTNLNTRPSEGFDLDQIEDLNDRREIADAIGRYGY